jgi:DNA-binding cell septation regulator SpoVG
MVASICIKAASIDGWRKIRNELYRSYGYPTAGWHRHDQGIRRLRLGGVTIKGAKVIQQAGQKAWVAMPSVKTDGAWQNVVELSKDLRDRVTDVVLAAWQDRPSRDAERGVAVGEALEDAARSWSQAERDRHAQELAARFQPDEEVQF